MATRIIVVRESEPKVFEKACNIGLRKGCVLHGSPMVECFPLTNFNYLVQILLWDDSLRDTPQGMDPDHAIATIKSDIELYKKE